MNRLKALLHPPVRLIILIDILSIPLVIIALKKLESTNPVSLAAYFISAYALTVTVINFGRLKDRLKELATGDELALVRGIKALMRRNKYTRRYLESRDFRAETALYAGLAVNMFYAVFKGVTGAMYSSPWLWSMGIYYLFLGGIRFFLMRGVRAEKRIEEDKQSRLHELKTYRLCGAMMMVLDLAVGGMAVQMIWQNKANEYSQAAVIISAAFTFYCFILAIYNAVSFRKRDSAVLSAAKNLSLTGALMSMFSLQTSMLHTFGNNDSDSYRRIMNSVTGGIVIAAVIAIATYMIIRGTYKINEIQEGETL
ncbi:MAG: hypothetical protein IJ561_05510 [Ruminococcus sp.]|nr:hypothetical protein [Ruminococcus sp.]